MPLPNDERVVALANDLLQAFDQIFGLHPGFRPAHAKGLMLTGTFTPSPGAKSLTKAPHVTRAATPVTARFSNSTGLPEIPDSVPDANPRGFAIRFNLAEHLHTDIVSHSTDGFPTRDGYQFLEFLRAIAASGPDPLQAGKASWHFCQHQFRSIPVLNGGYMHDYNKQKTQRVYQEMPFNTFNLFFNDFLDELLSFRAIYY